jgi:DNA-directed RNA polymerase subunit H (RpoH/RPB5)
MSTQNTSSLISAVYKSRNILLDLLKSQGYSIKDYEGFSVNEVNIMKSNNQLDMILEKDSQKSEIIDGSSPRKYKIYVRYYLAKTIRPQNLQEMIDDLFIVEDVLAKSDTLLIVVKDEPNETIINTLKHIWEKDNIFIIIQSLKRLQFNVLNHVLVPPHRIIKHDELINIKRRYNIMDDSQFPEISRFDPVAQAIGMRPGDVCEIIRPSKTAISAPYYRICVQ